jgi:dTDP-4-dehydrorhamnose 3,5-epimerase
LIFNETKLENAYIIELEKIVDDRGYFSRAWCQEEFMRRGLNTNIVQTNLSFNKLKGTIRGLHYQVAPYSEAKTVRCLKGSIYHVIIDLRPDSGTYLGWLGVILTAKEKRMLYVPESCAHGYQTLENNSESIYSVSQYYSPQHGRGIRWNDPFFDIKWPLTDNLVVSEQDKKWPDFAV